MAITELAIPSLRQDAETRATFLSTALPRLMTLLENAPGRLTHCYGFIIEENKKKVESALKLVIGVEWNSENSFQDFVGAEDFKKFRATAQPLAMAPQPPRIFETTASPRATFHASITEIFQVKIPHNDKLEAAKKAWRDVLAVISTTGVSLVTVSGISTNPVEKLFMGALGYSSLEERNVISNRKEVVDAREMLLALGDVTFLVVRFQSHL